MPPLNRRAVLGFGARVAAGVAGACALGRLLDLPSAAAEPVPPSGAAPTYLSGSFVSAARGGIETNWAIARPPGQTGPVRPVIALHGRNGSAASVMDLGIEDGLAQVVNAGLPSFAVVSVDGGNSYWHRRASGEDAGTMVLTELLPMLETKGRTSRGSLSWGGRWADTAPCS